MRRTVVIDDELLEEARGIMGTKTIRETIESGLKGTIRRHRLEEFRRSLGTIELDLTREELLRLRDAK